MEHPNISQGNLVADKVNVNLDVLHATMVDWISGHIDGANIATVHDGCKIDEANNTWTRHGPTLWYLALALELDNVVWRLEDQETRLSSRKRQKPEYVVRESTGPEMRWRPVDSVPFT